MRRTHLALILPRYTRGCVLIHERVSSVQDLSRALQPVAQSPRSRFLRYSFFFRIGLLSPSSKMTGVFENLNTDMHSNQITSSNYHSLHKSQESPTLPVSTATDSSYYNGQQPGHCAGSPFGQLGTYQYHSSATSSVPYNAKSYDLGFNSSYGTYGSYGSNSSPTPADTGRRALKFVLEHFACIQWLCL